jgi:mannose-6-phosphate isomerase
MANSDNVIRGALTPKFVDLPELVSVLSFNPEKVTPVLPSLVAACEEAYPIFVPDFEISRITVGPGRRYTRSARGPEILLCYSGRAEISCPGEVGDGQRLELGRGESAFASAQACDYEIGSELETVLFRASVPHIP